MASYRPGEAPLGDDEVAPAPMDPDPVVPGDVMVELLEPDPDRPERLREEVVPGVVDAPEVPVALEPIELFTPGVVWPEAPVEVDVPPMDDCGPPVPMEPVDPEPMEPEPMEPVEPVPIEPEPVAPAPAPPAAPPAPPAA